MELAYSLFFTKMSGIINYIHRHVERTLRYPKISRIKNSIHGQQGKNFIHLSFQTMSGIPNAVHCPTRTLPKNI